jgi:hypothetical protein
MTVRLQQKTLFDSTDFCGSLDVELGERWQKAGVNWH